MAYEVKKRTINSIWIYLVATIWIFVSMLASSNGFAGNLYEYMLSGNTGVDFDSNTIDIPWNWFVYWVTFALVIMASNHFNHDLDIQLLVRSKKRKYRWNRLYFGVLATALFLSTVFIIIFFVYDYTFGDSLSGVWFAISIYMSGLTLGEIINILIIRFDEIFALIGACACMAISIFISTPWLPMDGSMLIRSNTYSVELYVLNLAANIITMILIYLYGNYYFCKKEEL